MGGVLMMVGNLLLILFNDLLVLVNNNLFFGLVIIELLCMFVLLLIGVVLLIVLLLYFCYYGDCKLVEEELLVNDGVILVCMDSYFVKIYGIEGDVFELVVIVESLLVGMILGEVENVYDVLLLLVLKMGNDICLVLSVEMCIWVGSVFGVMGVC